MLSIGGPGGSAGQVHLTDRSIETAVIIGSFLRLVTSAEMGFFPWETIKLVNLARFLLKFDCSAAVKVLVLLAQEKITARKTSKIYLWVLGAAIDDPNLCVSAMTNDSLTATWTGENEFDTDATRCQVKGNVFNPQALSFTWWSIIPGEYLWALNRAWAMAGNTKDLPVKFKELLMAAKGA